MKAIADADCRSQRGSVAGIAFVRRRAIKNSKGKKRRDYRIELAADLTEKSLAGKLKETPGVASG